MSHNTRLLQANAKLTNDLNARDREIDQLRMHCQSGWTNYTGVAQTLGMRDQQIMVMGNVLDMRGQQIVAMGSQLAMRDQEIAALLNELANLRTKYNIVNGENIDVRAGAMPSYST